MEEKPVEGAEKRLPLRAAARAAVPLCSCGAGCFAMVQLPPQLPQCAAGRSLRPDEIKEHEPECATNAEPAEPKFSDGGAEEVGVGGGSTARIEIESEQPVEESAGPEPALQEEGRPVEFAAELASMAETTVADAASSSAAAAAVFASDLEGSEALAAARQRWRRMLSEMAAGHGDLLLAGDGGGESALVERQFGHESCEPLPPAQLGSVFRNAPTHGEQLWNGSNIRTLGDEVSWRSERPRLGESCGSSHLPADAVRRRGAEPVATEEHWYDPAPGDACRSPASPRGDSRRSRGSNRSGGTRVSVLRPMEWASESLQCEDDGTLKQAGVRPAKAWNAAHALESGSPHGGLAGSLYSPYKPAGGWTPTSAGLSGGLSAGMSLSNMPEFSSEYSNVNNTPRELEDEALAALAPLEDTSGLKPLIGLLGMNHQGHLTMSRPCTVSTASWDEIMDMDWGGHADDFFRDHSFRESSERTCDAAELQQSFRQGLQQGKELACAFRDLTTEEPSTPERPRPIKKVSTIIEGTREAGDTPRIPSHTPSISVAAAGAADAQPPSGLSLARDGALLPDQEVRPGFFGCCWVSF